MPRARRFPLRPGAIALVVLSLLGACTGARGSRPAATFALPAASDEPRELAVDQQIAQALARLTFGARPGDAQRLREMGLERWIALQLTPERIDDGDAERHLARYATLRRTPAELMRDYPAPALLRARQRVARRMDQAGAAGAPSPADSAELRMAAQRSSLVAQEIASARIARAVLSERQLQEVMVDFWENHFNVYAAKGPLERYYLADFDERVIRPHALGRFRDLLGAVAKGPAMLYYLDNWQSQADSGRPRLAGRRARDLPRGGSRPALPRRGLNENYGRELLELHTLGVDGGYTQRDVIEVARALTGWTVDRPREGGGFVFRPQMHDAGEKVVLGHRLAAGRGIEDGEAVLDILARHPATARYVATRLARRLVSDTPPAALVERAARRFIETDGDIRQVVWTIATSPEFYARAAYRAKVKSPLELVVSALRAVQGAPDDSPRTARLVARLGQPVFGHQAPDGWPDTGDAWINAGAILNRINFGLALAAGRVPGASPVGWPGARALLTAPRAAQVDGVIAALLGGDASPDTRAILLSGEHPFLQRGAPADGTTMTGEGARPELSGLPQIVGLAIGSPEFQRR